MIGKIVHQWLKHAENEFQCHKALYLIRFLFAAFSLIPIVLHLTNASSFRITDANIENTKKGILIVNGSSRPIIVNNVLELIFLVLARGTAFAMYPDLILVFLVKCRGINTLLSNSPFSIFMSQDNHEVHSRSGWFIFHMVGFHTVFHLLRWQSANNMSLIFCSAAGLTGLFVTATTPFLIVLMTSKTLKKKISYEWRKGLHYLFFVFAVVMAFHVPTTALPWGGYIKYAMIGVLLIYVFDSLIVTVSMTERISSPTFQVLPSGVQMKLTISDSFRNRLVSGGYVYVCIPWISRWQWHAFSLYESYSQPNDVFVFMNKVGDWTNELHSALSRKTSRPVWLSGPFPSPFHSADLYDNQILVASGIGITPALSILYFLRDHRRVNLIWTVRDPYMLEFFLSRMQYSSDAWILIYYTGKEMLNEALEGKAPNVIIYRTRPNLEKIVLKLIYGIESGISLPETIELSTKEKLAQLLDTKMKETHIMKDLDDGQRFKILSDFANENGYVLSQILNHTSGSGTSSIKGNIARRRSSLSSVGTRRRSITFQDLDKTKILLDEMNESRKVTHPDAMNATRKLTQQDDTNATRKSIRPDGTNVTIKPIRLDDMNLIRRPILLDDRNTTPAHNVKVNLGSMYSSQIDNIQGLPFVKGVLDNIRVDVAERIKQFETQGSMRSLLQEVQESDNDMLQSRDLSVKWKMASVKSLMTLESIKTLNSIERMESATKMHQPMKMLDSTKTINSIMTMESLKTMNSIKTMESSKTIKAVDHEFPDLEMGSVYDFFDMHAQNHDNALSFLQNLQSTKKGKSILDSWGILYCGGNEFIKKDLQSISLKFDINLNIESFAW